MLCEKLKEAREAAGKTQLQVAQFLGVAENTYCNYELGNRSPDALKIKKIARFLGVSGDFLLETGYDKKPPPRDEAQLVCYYRAMSPEGKEKALAVCEGLAEVYKKDSAAELVQEIEA